MARKGLVALLLVTCALVLGATVFQEQVAAAAKEILDVNVVNDAANPVPVHEQGTANVNVTNGTLSMSQSPVTGGGGLWIAPVASSVETIPVKTASALTVAFRGGASLVILSYQGADVAWVVGAVASVTGGAETVNVALTRPIRFDGIDCGGASSGPASNCVVSWVGAQP